MTRPLGGLDPPDRSPEPLWSPTVVTSARHMGPLWKVVQRKNFAGRKIVGDFVQAGGSNYNVLFDNCHQGANRMMSQ
ncbi:uncharacterized protein LOC117513546 [Thalassophryne amazonica]|uniref:uncharacterized protein LOC117513546 n=1 Tax=Thalassophryne amazonica TaxID=390379 RepID=UPI001471D91B|nr:uncharacterized protein LOC117513546 [Thalassophryne amazonica]